MFSNLVTPTDETGFPFLRIWPRGIRSTRLDVWWFALGESHPELEARWKQCSAFRGAPLSYQQRRTDGLHEQIERALGDDVPTHLRVEKRREPCEER